MYKPKAVCDSSPLIVFSKIGKLNLLLETFQKPLYIEQAVYDEVVIAGIAKKKPNAMAIKKYIDNGQIAVKKVGSVKRLPDLDYGENATISLALEEKIDLVCIDEIDGRTAAKQLALKPIGSLGILTLLLKNKKIGKKQALALLEDLLNAELRLSGELLKEFKHKVEENQDFLP